MINWFHWHFIQNIEKYRGVEELTLEGITVCKGRGNSRYRHSKKIINHMALDLEGYDKGTKSFTMFASMRTFSHQF